MAPFAVGDFPFPSSLVAVRVPGTYQSSWFVRNTPPINPFIQRACTYTCKLSGPSPNIETLQCPRSPPRGFLPTLSTSNCSVASYRVPPDLLRYSALNWLLYILLTDASASQCPPSSSRRGLETRLTTNSGVSHLHSWLLAVLMRPRACMNEDPKTVDKCTCARQFLLLVDVHQSDFFCCFTIAHCTGTLHTSALFGGWLLSPVHHLVWGWVIQAVVGC